MFNMNINKNKGILFLVFEPNAVGHIVFVIKQLLIRPF